MRKLIYGMNSSLDGYVAAPGDDIAWSVPSDELFQYFSDQVATTGLALYGRKLWETMSAHWPTADEAPDVSQRDAEFAGRWRAMPKVVFSSTVGADDWQADWNARLYRGDAVAEIRRLKAEDGGDLTIGGATLAGAAMRAGLIDEYQVAVHPVILGGGTSYFANLDDWVDLKAAPPRTFPDGVVLLRYETVRRP